MEPSDVTASAISHPWVQWLEIGANLATAIGIFLALASIVAAFKTNDDARAADRRSHMHSLFSEYLRTRYEKPNAQSDQERETLLMLKLYTLEELFEWVILEEKLAGPRWFRLWRRHEGRLAYIECWRQTIRTHLSDDARSTLEHISRYQLCYSAGFRDFAAMATSTSTRTSS